MKALLSFPKLLGFGLALFCLRLFLLAKVPVVADEAYYFFWGTHPAGGYYDLPPMVGWWESLITSFSLQTHWLRMPNLIAFLLIAFGVREWTRPAVGDRSSVLIALVFFFLPVPFLAVMVAPDIPLLFFTFYSSVLFFGARAKRDYFFSGALWGAAFLSKYFAVFSLPALILWYFYRRRGEVKRFRMVELCWFILGTLPFVFQHVLWNSTHCWANFVFNLMTRQKVVDGPWLTVVGLFVLYLLLMSTPFLWKGMFKKEVHSEPDVEKFFLISWLVPILLFATTALLGRGQGLHWYIPFLPFFVMWMGLKVRDELSLQRRVFGVMTVSLLLGSVVALGIYNPDKWVKAVLHDRLLFEYELAFRTDQMINPVIPDLKEVSALALDGYSFASLYDLELRRRLGSNAPPVLVMGNGSRFGRVFDFTADWRSLEGKNILLLARGAWSDYDWARFFDKTESKALTQNGMTYWVSKGIGFKYQLYKNELLKRSLDEFYPSFLSLPGRCEIKD